MSEVPAPLPGRPLYVSVHGGRVYVSAHDAFHLEQEREFKRKIRLAHPDRNHYRWASGRTRRLLKARQQFEAEEAQWYAAYGLEPPHGITRPRRQAAGESRFSAALLLRTSGGIAIHQASPPPKPAFVEPARAAPSGPWREAA
jgi:hypothetical protein